MTDLRTPSLVRNCMEGRETAALRLSGKKDHP
jgi:hypothetical protein